jgi:DNA-binding transcriptional LysR family regulator
VEAEGVPPVEVSLAWRSEDRDPAVLAFVDYVTAAAPTPTEV